MILIFSYDEQKLGYLILLNKTVICLCFIISFEELIQWITVMVLGSLAVVINQLLIYANILSSPPVNSMVSYIGGNVCLEILQNQWGYDIFPRNFLIIHNFDWFLFREHVPLIIDKKIRDIIGTFHRHAMLWNISWRNQRSRLW